MRNAAFSRVLFAAAALSLTIPRALVAASDPTTEAELRELRSQNEKLQGQLIQQQQLIDGLAKKIATLQTVMTSNVSPLEAVSAPVRPADDEAGSALRNSVAKAYLSGEGGIGFFESQSHGQFPNSEFRLDEAKLFVDAPVWQEVYFYTELNLLLREDPDLDLHVGEVYVDVEDLSHLWNRDGQLNLRLGRIDIPFGEEYLTRDAIDNPLISHSVMDFWGVDEGLELYGALGKFQYVVAVQNGGHSPVRDFSADKAVVARIGADPLPWLHLSASAMRTGDLDASQDRFSELWIGSGFVHSLGSTNTTRFGAEVFEGDLQVHHGRTTLKGSGGLLRYSDNDPIANNRREVYFYSVEGTESLTKRFYAAARWSQAFARKGFPIIGNGSVDDYFSRELTRGLSMLSLGLGYRWSKQLVLKGEYSLEWGSEADGTPRNHENLFSVMAAYAF